MSPGCKGILGAAVLVFAADAARASWPTNPAANLPICTAPGNQFEAIAVPDGSGGAILCWTDARSETSWDLRAQRVSASGDLLWTHNGVLVSNGPHDEYRPSMVSDGAGGVILAWMDTRAYYLDIYAQRLGADGVPQWPAGGVALCTAPDNQQDVVIASDGSGGAIAVWTDGRSGTDYHLYAQRIDGHGTTLWTENGVPISHPIEQLRPKIVADEAGGAIVIWMSRMSESLIDLYGQRLDADGQAVWGENGVPVADGPSIVYGFDVIADGAGGAIVIFDDDRNGLLDGFAQKLDAQGARLWPADGLSICTASGNQQHPLAVTDGAGGVIATWETDYRDGIDSQVFAHRVASDGAVPWQANGIPLANRDNQHWPAIVADGFGGAWIAWSDLTTLDLYAQRISGTGALEWGVGGLLVSGAPDAQTSPAIVSDGVGGAIIAWADARDSTRTDIYAQRVPFDQPTGVVVIQARATLVAGDAHLSWELRDFAGISFTVERRTESEDWLALGRPESRAGTLSYVDRGLQPGKRYGYRLAPAGGGASAGEIWVEGSLGRTLELRPSGSNPSLGGQLRVELFASEGQPAILEVFDPLGRRVDLKRIEPGAAKRTVECRGANGLSPGVYLVQVRQGSQSAHARVVVAH